MCVWGGGGCVVRACVRECERGERRVLPGQVYGAVGADLIWAAVGSKPLGFSSGHRYFQ